jgi:hypothetical protein
VLSAPANNATNRVHPNAPSILEKNVGEVSQRLVQLNVLLAASCTRLVTSK